MGGKPCAAVPEKTGAVRAAPPLVVIDDLGEGAGENGPDRVVDVRTGDREEALVYLRRANQAVSA
jgi:hypothetical protein